MIKFRLNCLQFFVSTVGPVLTEGPEALNVTSFEETIILSCEGFGFPIPTIAWYQNGTMIEVDEDMTTIEAISQPDNLTVSSVLTIVMPNVNNSGDYHCILSSSVAAYNDVMSEVVLVLVQGEYHFHHSNSSLC